ncbi:MAG: sugar phosphate isomerase/epimerase [Chloroflexi bacterium]|nr:sugar phosphate isomerase/epimerase [Chloroflexota bacterium]
MSTIAVSTIVFGAECTARWAMEFTVEHGFYGLELGSMTLWPEKMSRGEIRDVRVQAASNGVDLSIHFIHRGVAPASHDADRRAKHLAELEATLNLAHDIGARPIVVHPGPLDAPGKDPAQTSERERQEAIKYLADFLSKGARIAEETGTVICVENLVHTPGNVIRSYGELAALVESIGSPAVRITLDLGHADTADGLIPAFETFAPYLRHIHMHDSDGVRDHYEVGKGKIDYATLLGYLKPFPYTLALETQNTDDPAGGLLRSQENLRRMLGEAVR